MNLDTEKKDQSEKASAAEVANTTEKPAAELTEDEQAAQIKAQMETRKAAEQSSTEVAEEIPGAYKGIDPEFIVRCACNGELGDGMLYAELFRDKYLFNFQANSWMEWQGHNWDYDFQELAKIDVEDVQDAYRETRSYVLNLKKKAEDDGDDDLVKSLEYKTEQLYKAARRLGNDAKRINCLKCARANRNPLAISGDEFDQNPNLLGFSNCVVDLSTGEERGGAREDYLIKSSPIEWAGINAQCPAWEKALFEIMGDDQEKVDFLQRLFGYSASGSTKEQIFVVFYGEKGRNGKGVIVNILTRIFKNLAGALPVEMFLDQKMPQSASAPTPQLMDLRGMRYGFASETEEGRRFSASKIKTLSGGDQIVARNPHDKYNARFMPTHQLYLLTNFKPYAPADDTAFWERMVFVQFNMHFVRGLPTQPNERTRDNDLEEKLVRELPGIAAWIVRGALDYKQNGLQIPESIIEDGRSYRKEEDVYGQFIDDCLEKVDPPYFTLTKDVYQVFESWWCESRKRKSLPQQNTMSRKLGIKGFKSQKIKSVGLYGFTGLRINHDYAKQMVDNNNKLL